MDYFIFDKVTLENGSEFLIFDGEVVQSEKEVAGRPSSQEPSVAVVIPGHVHYLNTLMGIVETFPDVRKTPLAELQRMCQHVLKVSYEYDHGKRAAPYLAAERDTWNLQLLEATKFLDGQESSLISTLAEVRGEDPKDLANKIVGKDTLHKKALGDALITHYRQQARITNAKSVKDLPQLTLDDLRNCWPPMLRTVQAPSGLAVGG